MRRARGRRHFVPSRNENLHCEAEPFEHEPTGVAFERLRCAFEAAKVAERRGDAAVADELVEAFAVVEHTNLAEMLVTFHEKPSRSFGYSWRSLLISAG